MYIFIAVNASPTVGLNASPTLGLNVGPTVGLNASPIGVFLINSLFRVELLKEGEYFQKVRPGQWVLIPTHPHLNIFMFKSQQ